MSNGVCECRVSQLVSLLETRGVKLAEIESFEAESFVVVYIWLSTIVDSDYCSDLVNVDSKGRIDGAYRIFGRGKARRICKEER